MTGLGVHIIIDLFGCDFSTINDVDYLEYIFKKAIKIGEMTLLKHYLHKFNPHGASGIFLISESHLSFHSQPELGTITIDIFSCGDRYKSIKAKDYIIKNIKHDKSYIKVIERGFIE